MASESGEAIELYGALFTFVFIFLIIKWGDDAWHSKFRYALQYQVSFTHITKANKPYDCDWLTAPIGNKHCHYDPQVQAVLTAKSRTGSPIFSFDDGKTWLPNDGPSQVEAEVSITWEKAEE